MKTGVLFILLMASGLAESKPITLEFHGEEIGCMPEDDNNVHWCLEDYQPGQRVFAKRRAGHTNKYDLYYEYPIDGMPSGGTAHTK